MSLCRNATGSGSVVRVRINTVQYRPGLGSVLVKKEKEELCLPLVYMLQEASSEIYTCCKMM